MLVVAGLLVGATLVAAVAVMDSPGRQREQRLDARRVEDLHQIETMIDAWARSRQRLPTSLSELAAQPGVSLATTDPVGGRPYGYDVLDKRRYRLCAVFATDTAALREPAYRYAGKPVEWAHPAGRHCFERSLPREDVTPAAPAPPA
jgi:hypothetical protein